MDNPLLMPTYLTEEGDEKMEKRTEWGERVVEGEQ